MAKNIIKVIGLVLATLGCYLMVENIGWGGSIGVFLLMWANNTDYQKK
ncbi:MAG: hypothetical protein GY739_04015 [Mesoflavibacter sp.]|nr:hypothetical protein [Mesoflavibacter sp.]